MPFFSVIIPSYNRASILHRAIESILKQSFTDWELIIVDDGSIDSTEELVSSYKDSRIHYVFQKNKGVCAARNNGAYVSKGEFLCFLDSDDYVTENWLSDFFNLNDKYYHLLFCNMKLIRPNQEVDLISVSNRNKEGKYFGKIPGSWIIRKENFINAGMFDEKLKFGENTEFFFRINEENLIYGFVNRYNFIYNESHDGGSKNLKNKIESNLYILKKHLHYFKKNKNVLRLYYQNIAVTYAKLKSWKKAQIYFFKAYCVQPWKFKTLLRLLISFFPVIAKQIWKETN
jgi:glycosyltransferase involved in cell wall biosynthesis